MSVNHAEIHVTRGRPSDDELAAVLTVLMSALPAPDAQRGDPAAPVRSARRPRPGWLGKPSYRPPGAWTSAPHAHSSVAATGRRDA